MGNQPNIYVPTSSAEDWKRFLAEPSKQWKTGYSAKSVAECWEAAKPELPKEVKACLEAVGSSSLINLEMVLAIPEYKVSLPGGSRPSQTDVFALCRNEAGVVPLAIEGKVNEPFGPTVEEQLGKDTPGVRKRMQYLLSHLNLPEKIPGSIRYQLLHRTASALILADTFHAKTAAMVVHSFSDKNSYFDDFLSFVSLFGTEVELGQSALLGSFDGIELFVGWAKGEIL